MSYYTKSDKTKTHCTKRQRRHDPWAMPTTKRAPSHARRVFGRRLRAVRHERGLTLEDVAELADMHWSYISQVERGERNVGVDNMAALADAVGIHLKDLLDEEAGDSQPEDGQKQADAAEKKLQKGKKQG